MGVISNGADPFAEFIEDIPYNLGDLDPLHLNEEEGNDDAAIVERRPSRKTKVRMPVKPMHFNACGRRVGAKKVRRYENNLQLLDLVNSDDLGELSIHDFVSQGMSAFSQLLDHSENIKLWNDFINCSDDEQSRFLAEQFTTSPSGSAQKDSKPSTSIGDQQQLIGCLAAYTPDECFRKIGYRFRALLKKKHLPLGTLAQLESEVTNFFSEWPQAVYVSRLPSGYERLLLHALCRYLDLISESYGGKRGRETRVENPHKVFQPPSVLLTKYIEQRFHVQ